MSTLAPPAEIQIQALTKRYVSREESLTALEDVTLTIGAGEFICLLGPSGCGKTTLLNCLAGFVQPTSGSISMNGKPIGGPASDRGVVFQDHGLLPWYTVEQNVGLGPLIANVPNAERRELVLRYIAMVGLSGFESRFPAQLSGGMKQRVGIARALANRPQALFMDEPFGALDAQTRQVMQEELLRIWEAERKTIVFVTHSIPEAIFLADRVVVMSPRPGKIAEIVPVSLPRPRERTSSDFSAVYRHLEDLMKGFR
jgi:ABC-type nitrate/sulfonate/bicarbonate transport system ATPase subunit